MEWGKAKNYLIYMLIGVNIFLFCYNIFNSYSWRISKDILKNTEKILADRGVMLEISLPSKMYPRIKAQMKDYDVDVSKLKADLSQNVRVHIDDTKVEYFSFESKDRININNIEHVRKFLTRWMRDNGLDYKGWQISEYGYIILNFDNSENMDNDAAYKQNKYMQFYKDIYKNYNILSIADHKLTAYNDFENEDSKVLVMKLTQKYKKYMIYSNEIFFIVGNNGIRYFCMPKIFKKVVNIYTDKQTPIIPAHQVLIANFTKPDAITALDIGFSSDFNSEDSVKISEEYPVWRVTTRTGQILFFDTIEGKIKQ